MALAKTVNFKGVQIADAYHRVFGVTVEKDKISFGLGVHVSPESERLDSSGYSCAYDIDGENPIKQAYEYLKTLDHLADAADV